MWGWFSKWVHLRPKCLCVLLLCLLQWCLMNTVTLQIWNVDACGFVEADKQFLRKCMCVFACVCVSSLQSNCLRDVWTVFLQMCSGVVSQNNKYGCRCFQKWGRCVCVCVCVSMQSKYSTKSWCLYKQQHIQISIEFVSVWFMIVCVILPYLFTSIQTVWGNENDLFLNV